jgi:uncharacterized membrane protein YdjX (TVP38/TMEM64 family)
MNVETNFREADPADPAPAANPTDPVSLRRADIYSALRKLAIVIAVVGAYVAIIHFTDLREILDDTNRIKTLIQSHGAWGPVSFIGGATILILTGMPRLLFCVLGGALFGFIEGLIYSQIATIIGAYGTFLFARWSTQGWVRRLKNNQSRFYRMLENPNLLTVFLSRQLPSGGVFISLFLGFSSVSHMNFFIGSLLGFLPEAIPAVLIGSGAGKTSMMMAFAQILTAAAVLVFASIVIVQLSAVYKKRHR